MRYRLFFALCVPLMLWGCRIIPPVQQNDGETKQASVFDNNTMQRQFESLTFRVYRIVTYVTYESQVFEQGSGLTLKDLEGQGFDFSLIKARLTHNESFSGTGILIKGNAGKSLLLTCAHVIDFPDTVFTYDDNASSSGHRYLLGLSVKTSQVIQVSGNNLHCRAEILVSDPVNDLALLEIPPGSGEVHGVIPMAVGSDLAWGDRVWLTGYPSGRFMMTSGLISNPGNSDGLLMTDAPFSEGYSGAPAFVYDRRANGFRLAGIGRSVAARSSYVLRPEKEIHEAPYNISLPYTGPVYVRTEREPAPGVTFLIGSSMLDDFLKSCDAVLQLNGWGGLAREMRQEVN